MAKITLKSHPIQTNGKLPEVGSQVPDFQLVDTDLKERSLKDFKGKKKLLSFVPSLDTPTCSISTKKFNEALQKYPQVAALVISCDLPFAQKRACVQEHVEHITSLSMMRDKKCASDYGILILDGPIAGLCARAIVITDENNRVIYTELVQEISQEPNYEKALACL